MRLFNILTRKEIVAGMEVSDTYLRVALLELMKKRKALPEPEVRFLLEQPLEKGIVTNGIIEDQKRFAECLDLILKQSKIKVECFILSIPSNNMFSRIISFPKVVSGEKLEEAVALAADYQLPVNKDEVYFDWQVTPAEKKSEVLLVSVAKAVVDSYINAFKSAGLNLRAVEFNSISISRVIDISEEEATLIFSSDKSSSNISIFKDKTLYFNRIIPYAAKSKQALEQEVRKVIDFFEAETEEKIVRSISLDKIAPIGPFSSCPLLNQNWSNWFASLGAAKRGLLERSEDNLISVMPVGTEESYEWQKAMVFSGFLLSIITGLCVFFIIAFLGTWMLMLNVHRGIANKSNKLATLPVEHEWEQLSAKAVELNDVVNVGSTLTGEMPEWSLLLEDLRARTVEGILINELIIPPLGEGISLKGVAQSRNGLNEFKKSLEKSDLISEVKMPLTDMEKKENIPFSINFKIKDRDALKRE